MCAYDNSSQRFSARSMPALAGELIRHSSASMYAFFSVSERLCLSTVSAGGLRHLVSRGGGERTRPCAATWWCKWRRCPGSAGERPREWAARPHRSPASRPRRLLRWMPCPLCGDVWMNRIKIVKQKDGGEYQRQKKMSLAGGYRKANGLQELQKRTSWSDKQERMYQTLERMNITRFTCAARETKVGG